MPIVGRRRSRNTANQRIGTDTSPNSSGLEGHVLESGGAGTSDLGFVSVDEPRCPVQAFHPQGEQRLSTLVDFTRPVVEHSARVSEESGLGECRRTVEMVRVEDIGIVRCRRRTDDRRPR